MSLLYRYAEDLTQRAQFLKVVTAFLDIDIAEPMTLTSNKIVWTKFDHNGHNYRAIVTPLHHLSEIIVFGCFDKTATTHPQLTYGDQLYERECSVKHAELLKYQAQALAEFWKALIGVAA